MQIKNIIKNKSKQKQERFWGELCFCFSWSKEFCRRKKKKSGNQAQNLLFSNLKRKKKKTTHGIVFHTVNQTNRYVEENQKLQLLKIERKKECN